MYSAKINGEPTTFGTSGLLYRSNKVMYDRATNSLWNHLIGEPVIGPLADSGIKLDFFPVILTTWGEWIEEHPDTTVLALDTGSYSARSYQPETDPRAIYYAYFNSPNTMFPVWDRDDSLETKDVVLALSIDDSHKAYPVDVLQMERVVNDTLGETEIVAISSATTQGARAYLSDGRRFSIAEDADTPGGLPNKLVDSDGVVWRATENALINESNSTQTLARLPSHMAFWFGWFAFHPDTELYEAGQGG